MAFKIQTIPASEQILNIQKLDLSDTAEIGTQTGLVQKFKWLILERTGHLITRLFKFQYSNGLLA
jgi:hypothetical protein